MATIYGLAKKLEVTNAGTFATQSLGKVSVSGTPTTRTGLSLATGSVIPAHVAIVDASGNQITSFGGGGGLTDTELRASAVPVSGSVSISNTVTVASADNTDNASLTTTGNAQTFTNVQSYSTGRVQITGTWTGTLTFQGSVDGATFSDIHAQLAGGTGALVSTATANGTYLINVAGLAKFRVYATSIGTGTAEIDTHLSIGGGPIQIGMPLPAGTNAIGKLAANSSGVLIGQVEIAASQTVGLVAGSAIVGKVGIDQTSDGTTNLVRLGAETTKVIGTVNIAAAQSVGLAAGTNGIGKLTANSGVTIGAVEIVASQSVAVTQATASSLNAQVVGNVADAASDSGNPVKIGARVISARPSSATAANRANLVCDQHQNLFVRHAAQPQDNTFYGNNLSSGTVTANTQGTKTIAAAGSGLKNVCTEIHATIASTAAPTPTQLYIHLRDGSSGSGTILRTWVVSLTATSGDRAGISLTGLWIPGTANTQMTLEFSAAGGASTYEVVSLSGVIVAA